MVRCAIKINANLLLMECQEDAMSVHGCLMNQEYVDYYAVFDGHGGKEYECVD